MEGSEEHSASAEVCKFYLENKCRFGDKCRNLHPGSEVITTESVNYPEGTVVVEDPVPESPTHSTAEFTKKPRMKTAQEVINRLLWDPELNTEDFSLHYQDRFTGLVEIPLTSYHSMETGSEESIPQHRIQQIAYKDRIVWDKKQKLDFVFGSTGYEGTILDFIIQSEN